MTHEVDETELLKDLDKETMAATFEDVGLSLTQVVGSPDDRCGSSSIIKLGCNFSGTFSRVLDTSVSEHYHGCDGEVQSVKLQGQEVVCNGVSSQRDVGNASAMNSKVSKDSPIEFLAGDLCLGTEMHLTPQSYYSNQTTSKMLATNQEVNVDIHSFYTKENTVSSLRLQESGNEENEDHVALDRFRSRWLGGWTWKDAKVYGDVNLNTVQCIPRFPITECSSLSESANTIIEDCSSIQKPEAEGKIASVSSLAYGSLCSIGNKEILNSQDLVRASTLSLADPLCSVVPCSIPSGNNNLGIAADQENGESSNGCFRGEVKLTLKINCEGSVASKSRRELTSLKSYSRLLTSQRGSFERCKGISGFLSSDNFIGCLKHSKEAGPSELPLSNATTKSHDKEYWKDKKKNVDGPEDVNCACMSISEYVSTTDKGDVNLRRLSTAEMEKSRNIVSCEDQNKVKQHPLLLSIQEQNTHGDQGPSRKKVCFSEAVVNECKQTGEGQRLQSCYQTRSVAKASRRLKEPNPLLHFKKKETNTCPKKCHTKDTKRLIFQGVEFLLTGFTRRKEIELEKMIRKYGGFVLSDIPLPSQNFGRSRRSRFELRKPPLVLSPKKLQTTKFLYGCAVNAFLLKVSWLTDSVVAGSKLPPDKYLIFSNREDMHQNKVGWLVITRKHMYIFEKVGIMFHGKHSFCTKFARIVKHGGGQVFQTLQWLIQSLNDGKISAGVFISENENRVSRHLRHCAYEQKLPILPLSWIINSLHSGKLLPFVVTSRSMPVPTFKMQELPDAMELSEEI